MGTGVLLQVDLLVFDGSPQAFGEDVVHVTASTVHGDSGSRRREAAREALRREVAGYPLMGVVGVDDLRHGLGQRLVAAVQDKMVVSEKNGELSLGFDGQP